VNNSIDGIVTVTKALSEGHHDLSMWALFSQASFTVKAVVITLIMCSFWCWTIIFAKMSLLKKLKKKANEFEASFWKCGAMEAFFNDTMSKNEDHPFVNVFTAGMKELGRARNRKSFQQVMGRVETAMRVTLGREIDFLELHVSFLATTGSTAPFVGLFGTVWGIMNSFESIGLDQNTSLTAVAPGIAEALFATALGLVVTIPAVIAYNKISLEINRYQNRLEAFIDEFSSVISRQIDE
jgi:biopolymer transport protein TolQ